MLPDILIIVVVGDNLVMSVFSAPGEGLWVGAGAGIFHLETHSPFRLWGERQGFKDRANLLYDFKDEVYLRTSSGIHIWKDNLFEQITDPDLVQMITLQPVTIDNGQDSVLILTTLRGMFELSGGKQERIDSVGTRYFTIFQPEGASDYFWAGGDQGIEKYVYRNKTANENKGK